MDDDSLPEGWTRGTKSAPVFVRQLPNGEYEIQSEPFADNFEPGPIEGLCKICSQIPWAQILEGERDAPPVVAFKFSGEYADAAFGEGTIPNFEKMVTTQQFCHLCRLFLRARQATFPDREIGEGDCSDSDDSNYEYGESYFTYYAGDVREERSYQGAGRGVDDDDASWARRLINLAAFRLRLRGKHAINNFETPIELTMLAENLPPHRRTHAGRLIPPECARPDLFKDWSKLCRRRHGYACNPLPGRKSKDLAWRQLKLRLIELDTLRVVVAPAETNYCALSYVWGAAQGFRAERAYFEPDGNRPGEIYMDLRPFYPVLDQNGRPGPSQRGEEFTLPRTITDAMAVAKMVGERYLWIDALCIVQDDIEELRTVLRQMDLIYKNASLTIVAAAGKDNQAGLTRAHEVAPNWEQIKEDVMGLTVFLAQPSLTSVLEQSTWSDRAWTFQEQKFSRRQLIFTDKGIYWKCQKETWSEDSEEEVASPKNEHFRPNSVANWSSSSPMQDAERAFADFTYDLRLYTERKFTNQGDAVRGFSGIISDFQRGGLIKSEFDWGLPRTYLDAALLWKNVDAWSYHDWVFKGNDKGKEGFVARGYHTGYTFDQLTRRVVSGSYFPSWSWCGWIGSVGYYPRLITDPNLELLQAIQSEVEWPWQTSSSSWIETEEWKRALSSGILTFRAQVARVDFNILPAGRARKENEYTFWGGWPMDGGPVIKTGIFECVLLSRQLRHPINYVAALWTHYRHLDPDGPLHLYNVMVISRDEKGLASRMGIGMIREDHWKLFRSSRQIVRLR